MGAICYGTLGNNRTGEGAGRLQDLRLVKIHLNMRSYWRQRKLITLRDSNVTTHLSDLVRKLRNLFTEGFYSGGSWELRFLSCQLLYFLGGLLIC